jgi:hypothetical protein
MSGYVLSDPTLPLGVSVIGSYADVSAAEAAARDYALKHAPMEVGSAVGCGAGWLAAVERIRLRLIIESGSEPQR